jgi:hypothetical protein
MVPDPPMPFLCREYVGNVPGTSREYVGKQVDRPHWDIMRTIALWILFGKLNTDCIKGTASRNVRKTFFLRAKFISDKSATQV